MDYQHAAMLRLGKFASGLPFWELSPHPELLSSLPDGMAANVLSNGLDVLAIQLLDGKANATMDLELPEGRWKISWFNPSTGFQLKEETIHHSTKRLSFRIPDDSPHLIVHMEKVN
ncbi:hypothetical protein [Cyclobacterium jeungdonense]|uniref:Uncharacterized protein n=1 Tax=Cyclobacterium jeungdonense TaxID=708087 RepID=A0ABT8CAN7_9BACT|nr:hypothetical protein [Cyclobacterium jeungdonense]MDN3689873.1 hypothetical protein [Cyclobacterium jeungdonense]